MLLPRTAHTDQPWRIHAIADDFAVEDVWAVPTPGGPDDFARLVDLVTSGRTERFATPVMKLLFASRWALGRLFGWDDPDDGLGRRVASLRDRLPADLRAGNRGPDLGRFASLYRTHDEWAAEIANETVHGVLHLGWVPDGAGRYRGQLAVLVKPNGRWGSAYLIGIRPFRYLGVYPPMLRAIGREWAATASGDRSPATS